jgi:hypothetical protein
MQPSPSAETSSPEEPRGRVGSDPVRAGARSTDRVYARYARDDHHEEAAMYASIRRYPGVPRELGVELCSRGYAETRRRLAERPGFVAYEVVLGDDELVAITIFHNWVTAVESNAFAAEWIAENAAWAGLPPPEIVAGELFEQSGEPSPFQYRPPKVRSEKEAAL